MTTDEELEKMRPQAWVPYGNHIWVKRDDYETLEEFAREQALSLADVESENARLAPVIAWIRENHVKKHDSDTLDVDHGPIVEWDYCDWCADHGLPEDWPCMFVLALATVPAAPAGASAEAGAAQRSYSACCACDGTGRRRGVVCDNCNGTCCSYHYKGVDPSCGSCRIA